MLFDDEIICPKCEKGNVDTLTFAYKALQSENAGRRLFSDSPIKKDIKEMSPQKKEKLLHKLTPPAEPSLSLPAGALAGMAFAISWLATGSIIIARIGQMAYSIISIIITVSMGSFFYYTLIFVMRRYRKKMSAYKKEKALYNKKYLCNNCHYIFTLEK